MSEQNDNEINNQIKEESNNIKDLYKDLEKNTNLIKKRAIEEIEDIITNIRNQYISLFGWFDNLNDLNILYTIEDLDNLTSLEKEVLIKKINCLKQSIKFQIKNTNKFICSIYGI